MRRAGIATCLVIAACGARTDLGGKSKLGDAGLASDAGDAGDADFGDAGPPPPPCRVTAPTILASGGKEIQFVGLDDDDVFWTDFALGTVSAVAKGGGEARVLAAGRENPSGVAAKDGTVYWTEFNGNMVASTPAAGGGAITTIAAKQDGAYDITLSGSTIYWTTFRSCTVSRIDEGKSTQLDKAKQPFSDIASAGSLVFWISFEKKSVERYDATSGARSTIVNGGTTPPFAIATDGASLYFGETSSSATTIGSVPAGGGAATTLFSSDCSEDSGLVGTCLAGLATDGATLYFTGEGQVRKMPVGGGASVVVADGQARPYSVAVDESCVYWSNLGDGTVWAAPK
ncbi:MAG TPA: hypothetical protein VGH28_02740 [Polyangiaceae bacterium]